MTRLSALALCLCTLPMLAQAPAKADKKPEKPHFEFGVPDKPFTSDAAKLIQEKLGGTHGAIVTAVAPDAIMGPTGSGGRAKSPAAIRNPIRIRRLPSCLP